MKQNRLNWAQSNSRADTLFCWSLTQNIFMLKASVMCFGRF